MAGNLSGNCIKCGIYRRSLHEDHIIPYYKGGSSARFNIQLLCANCHEDKTREDLRGPRGEHRFIFSRWRAASAIRARSRRWVYAPPKD